MNNSFNLQNFGRSLRFVRLCRGIEQIELAEKTGLSSSYISLLEAGKRSPSWETLAQLLGALNVTMTLVSMLMERDDTFVRPIMPLAYQELERTMYNDTRS